MWYLHGGNNLGCSCDGASTLLEQAAALPVHVYKKKYNDSEKVFTILRKTHTTGSWSLNRRLYS